MKNNLDKKTINSFGDEWTKFDQKKLNDKEAQNTFQDN